MTVPGRRLLRARRLVREPDHVCFHAEIDIQAGVIAAIRSRDQLGPGQGDPDTIVVPALANAHDHGRGLRPMAYGVEDGPVEAWVPATYTHPRLDPYLVAVVAFARMARSGIASVVHCHLSAEPDRLAAAARAVARAAGDVGIKVAFVVPLRDRNRLGYGPDDAILACLDPADRAAVAERWLRPIPALARQLAVFDEIAASCESPTFRVQYGPIGVEWCSDALLAEVARRSEASGRRVHMHLLETVYQRAWTDARYPGGVVARLDELGLVSSRLTVAHGTWLRPDEAARLARGGATVSVNTSSNLRLRSGIAPVPEFRRARLAWAIGLDALALDDDDDMWREMRLTQLLHAGRGFEAGLQPGEVFQACRLGGCRACGFEGGGPLAEGSPADLVVLDWPRLASDLHLGLHQPFGAAFARATAGHVRDVFVAGREVVREGVVTGVDAPTLEGDLRREMEAAVPELVATKPLLARYQAALARFYQAGGHLAGGES